MLSNRYYLCKRNRGRFRQWMLLHLKPTFDYKKCKEGVCNDGIKYYNVKWCVIITHSKFDNV